MSSDNQMHRGRRVSKWIRRRENSPNRHLKSRKKKIVDGIKPTRE
jgi:hypothetical protein